MKAENFILASIKSLKPEPVPTGMDSREIVRRSIEFTKPPRIPYYFLFHPTASDILILGPLSAASHQGNLPKGQRFKDEWGVCWEGTGRYWAKAVGHPLSDLNKLEGYSFPDIIPSLRQARPFFRLGRWAGKYLIGYNPVNMYERMRSLMGFEELMIAPYSQPDGLRALLNRLADLTIAAIDFYGAIGLVDGFLTSEDWGLQTALQMNIDTFREFYKPVYQRIIDACHLQGMHFLWHNCGYIIDMFSDMIEMGVDVLQLDQPRLMGHQNLIDVLGGHICMWNTVDIQWCTSNQVSDEQIRQEIAAMVKIYSPDHFGGGYIAKHYPQPWDIRLTIARQRLIYDAFMENGCRL